MKMGRLIGRAWKKEMKRRKAIELQCEKYKKGINKIKCHCNTVLFLFSNTYLEILLVYNYSFYKISVFIII